MLPPVASAPHGTASPPIIAMHPHTLRALACACLLPSALAAAESLIFNGGFELGTAGFEVNKNIRPDTNPTLVFEGAVLDTTTKVSGNQSLKIPNRFAEFMELYARGVTLKPNTTYTVSVSMKTDVDALSVTPLVVANDFKPARGATVTVGRTWKRYSNTFTTGPLKIAGETSPQPVPAGAPVPAVLGAAIWIRTNLAAGELPVDVPNTLWIDDLELNEGAGTTFGPSAEVEAAVTVAKDLYVEGDGYVGTSLVVRNTTARTVHGSVQLRLEEEEGAPARTIAGYDLTLAAGEVRTLTQSTLVDRFGAFTVTPIVSFDATADVLPACFARAGKYVAAAAQVDLATTFCISNNDGAIGRYSSRETLTSTWQETQSHHPRAACPAEGLIARTTPSNPYNDRPVGRNAFGSAIEASSQQIAQTDHAAGLSPAKCFSPRRTTTETDDD